MKRIVFLALAAALIVSSCNLPDEGETSPNLATAAALTVEAALDTAGNVTPLASPALSTPLSEGTTTPLSSQPLVGVDDVVNCRTGPGVNYERVTQLQPGESAPIIGFFPPNYWIVSTDEGPCWVSGEFVTPSGDFAAVPTVAAPATPQGGVPAEPTFTQNGWSYFCANDQAEITLNWNDKAVNETGYRVIRNGERAAELPANSSTYSETISLLSGQSVSYQIQAYNAAGQSTSRTATMTCP
jgi:uncharacterized protein YraI